MKEGRVVYYTKAHCSLYSLRLKPPYSGETFAEFEDWFAQEVNLLPAELNATTINVFEKFYQDYGDHVITRCKRVGG